MPGLVKMLYTPLLFDCLFALAASLGVIGVVLDANRAYPAVVPAAEPLIKGAALVGTMLAAAMLAIVATRFDQKHADDFLYHVLTKSAFIAMFTAFFVLAFWQILFAARLGGLSSHTTVGVLATSWSLGYFYTRVRGTGS
jgi:hypothetical protein